MVIVTYYIMLGAAPHEAGGATDSMLGAAPH